MSSSLSSSSFGSSMFSSSLQSSESSSNTIKIAIMGAATVGKTAIIHQFLHRRLLRSYWPTVQERYFTELSVEDEQYSLDILDTPGAYCFQYPRKLAINLANIFVLVYSVENEVSFETIANLRDVIIEQKPPGVQIIVVGNKTDVPPRFMSYEKAKCMVNVGWKHTYMETSAKNVTSVTNMFQQVVAEARLFQPIVKIKDSVTVAVLKGLKRRFSCGRPEN